MSNNTGKWLPMNLDGGFHSCNQNQTGTKKVEPIVNEAPKTQPLSLEELDARLKRLKGYLWDHRND